MFRKGDPVWSLFMYTGGASPSPTKTVHNRNIVGNGFYYALKTFGFVATNCVAIGLPCSFRFFTTKKEFAFANSFLNRRMDLDAECVKRNKLQSSLSCPKAYVVRRAVSFAHSLKAKKGTLKKRIPNCFLCKINLD